MYVLVILRKYIDQIVHSFGHILFFSDFIDYETTKNVKDCRKQAVFLHGNCYNESKKSAAKTAVKEVQA